MTSDIFKISLIFNAFVVKCKIALWFVSFFLKSWVQKCFCSKREEYFKNPLFPMNVTNMELILKKSINDLKYICKSKLVYYENSRMPLGRSFLLEWQQTCHKSFVHLKIKVHKIINVSHATSCQSHQFWC